MLSLKTPAEVAQELATRLRARRLRKGWTQKELAERAGLRVATYIHFERTGEIALHRLLRLFDVFGLLDEFDRLARQEDLSRLRLEDVIAPERKRGRRKS